jgi:esterase/lipase superfamily enzyme
VRKEILVFIHGYNVSFEDGARRAAQVAYDLGFDKARGAPVLYSWPSQAAFEMYIKDETNIRVTVHHLRTLLTNLVAQSGAHSIHLMAHSMGNQALAEALELIGTEMGQTNKAPFNQVVMAAPDIDVDLLVNMSPAIRKTASRFTIYSCEEDLPVRLSKWLHGDLARVGSFAVLDGFDTIDTTRQVLEGLLKHTYFADVPSILWDIRSLLECGCPASERCCCCFETREAEQRRYWVFKAGAVDGCTHKKQFTAP